MIDQPSCSILPLQYLILCSSVSLHKSNISSSAYSHITLLSRPNFHMATTEDLRVSNLFSLKDYVCLVTGGGTGIGLMATQVLAANGTSPARTNKFHY